MTLEELRRALDELTRDGRTWDHTPVVTEDGSYVTGVELEYVDKDRVRVVVTMT